MAVLGMRSDAFSLNDPILRYDKASPVAKRITTSSGTSRIYPRVPTAESEEPWKRSLDWGSPPPQRRILIPSSSQGCRQYATLKVMERQLMHRALSLEKQVQQVDEMLSRSRDMLGMQPSTDETRTQALEISSMVDCSKTSPSKMVSFWSSCSASVEPTEAKLKEAILSDSSACQARLDEELMRLPRSWSLGAKKLVPTAKPQAHTSSCDNIGLSPQRKRVVRTPLASLSGKDLSSALQSVLVDLRRAGPFPEPFGEDGAESMMTTLLGETTDTVESLRQLAASMAEQLQSASGTGGHRHATTVLSRRVLAIVEKKGKLLSALETGMNAYQAALSDTVELFSAAISLVGFSLAKPATGFRQLIKDSVHDGDPRLANKSQFDMFVRRLGLHPHHQMVMKARAVLDSGTEELSSIALQTLSLQRERTDPEEWLTLSKGADEMCALLLELSVPATHAAIEDLKFRANSFRAEYVLHLAEMTTSRDAARSDGAGGKSALKLSVQLRRAVEEVERLGVPEACREVSQAKALVLELRAQAVLRDAQRDWDFDEEGKLTNSYIAAACARIRVDSNAAIEFGVAEKDPALIEARRIADNLQCNKVLRIATSFKEMDAKAVAAGSYRSGAATNAASIIDSAVQDAFSVGAPEGQPALMESMKIMKFLREQEGLRKRQRYTDARKGL